MNDRNTWRNEHGKMIKIESKIRKLKAGPSSINAESDEI